MKKFYNHIIACSMALLLAACTEKDLLPIDYSGQGKKDMYLNLAINVPDSKSSRTFDQSDSNAQLTTGDENEDKIINAFLLLFKVASGGDVDEAVFCGSFAIWDYSPQGEVPPHIANSYKTTIVLNDFEKEDKTDYYGLVVANVNGTGLGVHIGNKSFSIKTPTGTMTYTPESSLTYSTFKALMIDGNISVSGGSLSQKLTTNLTTGANYLTMNNAMLFAEHEEDANETTPTMLVDVTDKLEESVTEAEAEGNTAVFYIERVAAKVQVDCDVDGDEGDDDESGTFKKRSYTIKEWCLINVSNTSYVMRNWQEGSTTWPGLKSTQEGKDFRFLSNTQVADGAGYRCYYANTTYTGTDGWSNPSSGHNFYYTNWSDFGKVQYCHENTMDVLHMKVKNATHVLVEVEFNGGVTFTTSDGRTYTNGLSYYVLPISHFGNEFTPWHAAETPQPEPIDKSDVKETDTQKSYPETNRDANYLGRWGCVRNTWYKLTITGIKDFGLEVSPIDNPYIVIGDPTPLDYYENLLYTTVKVNEWNVRDQSVVLQ